MKFHVFTFGCQMNVADSDWLVRALKADQWTEAAEDEADLFIINTCSVREKPEQKVYSLLGRLKRYWERDRRVFAAVGGCVAQQVGEGLWERFPFVRLVFGTDGVAMAPQALRRLAAEPGLKISLLDFTDEYPERKQAWPEKGAGSQAFVNIMQGCDNFCAYCIVPYVRGRQKSRESRAVIEECRDLALRGVREITLLGQNVNSYGLDKHGDGTGFAELLHKVAAIPGLNRLRFTTSHPKDLDPAVIEAFGRLDNLCPHLHLPLQSGSDKVLKAMGRGYTMARYEAKIEALRAARPGLVLTTDLIVGFPGETEADFEQTMDAVARIGFESSFSFKYSDRPGVRAARMQPKVPEEVKTDRLARLQELQDRLTTRALAAKKGTLGLVLVEGPSKKQESGSVSWRGRDEAGRVVNIAASEGRDLTGDLVEVSIVEAKKHSLSGKVVSKA